MDLDQVLKILESIETTDADKIKCIDSLSGHDHKAIPIDIVVKLVNDLTRHQIDDNKLTVKDKVDVGFNINVNTSHNIDYNRISQACVKTLWLDKYGKFKFNEFLYDFEHVTSQELKMILIDWVKFYINDLDYIIDIIKCISSDDAKLQIVDKLWIGLRRLPSISIIVDELIPCFDTDFGRAEAFGFCLNGRIDRKILVDSGILLRMMHKLKSVDNKLLTFDLLKRYSWLNTIPSDMLSHLAKTLPKQIMDYLLDVELDAKSRLNVNFNNPKLLGELTVAKFIDVQVYSVPGYPIPRGQIVTTNKYANNYLDVDVDEAKVKDSSNNGAHPISTTGTIVYKTSNGEINICACGMLKTGLKGGYRIQNGALCVGGLNIWCRLNIVLMEEYIEYDNDHRLALTFDDNGQRIRVELSHDTLSTSKTLQPSTLVTPVSTQSVAIKDESSKEDLDRDNFINVFKRDVQEQSTIQANKDRSICIIC